MINEPKLDLACGASKREGFAGVDVAKVDGVDYVVDLEQYPWPIESNSVEELHCSHYVEHIPHDINNPNDKRDGFIQFMDEVYRILKPGGKITIIAPYWSSMRAFGDPTHKRYMCELSFFHFNKEWRDENGLAHYGIKSDFDAEFSYIISNDMVLKSEEVKRIAFLRDLNTVDDIKVDLVKR